jgi:hypothetical protein
MVERLQRFLGATELPELVRGGLPGIAVQWIELRGAASALERHLGVLLLGRKEHVKLGVERVLFDRLAQALHRGGAVARLPEHGLEHGQQCGLMLAERRSALDGARIAGAGLGQGRAIGDERQGEPEMRRRAGAQVTSIGQEPPAAAATAAKASAMAVADGKRRSGSFAIARLKKTSTGAGRSGAGPERCWKA